jgi:hypothetical protein
MKAIATRAERDFLEVYSRLNAVCAGLCEFYSITDPTADDLKYEMAHARSRIEGTLNWVRRATNALGRAKMDDQECTIRVSVPPGAGGLIEQLSNGLVLQFPADQLVNMKRAQLRGISATVEPDNGAASIDIEVTSPQQKLQYVNITLPGVITRMGRVSSRESLNSRDVAGGRPMINRSPVGDWTLRALKHDRGEQFQRLHLDFHIAFC